jgi:hypothetical protein
MTRRTGPARPFRPSSLGDPSIDLHGIRVAPALDMVEEFLRDHVAQEHWSVRIISGTGTGAMKKAVRAYLDRHPLVEAWRPSLQTDAVTVVDLRPPRRAPSPGVVRPTREQIARPRPPQATTTRPPVARGAPTAPAAPAPAPAPAVVPAPASAAVPQVPLSRLARWWDAFLRAIGWRAAPDAED